MDRAGVRRRPNGAARSHAATGQNRLLQSLPPTEARGLKADLELVELPFKQELFKPNENISHVLFPVTGVVSLVSKSMENVVVEVATIGNEGLVGLPVFLGADRMPGHAFVQVPGTALRMRSERFRKHVERQHSLVTVINLYSQALFMQVAQGAACNRVHSTEERAARWLLMTHDRMTEDVFMLTQEFLAQMLGTRRAAVNAVASKLQRAGLIRYARGRVTVVNRKELEAAACECYRIIRDEYARLMPAVERVVT